MPQTQSSGGNKIDGKLLVYEEKKRGYGEEVTSVFQFIFGTAALQQPSRQVLPPSEATF